MATKAAMRTGRTNCTLDDMLIAMMILADLGRHCTEGDVEVSLSRASASTEGHGDSSSSSLSSSTAGEAIDCHSHAGVE
jgi:hypothetical protein